MFNSPTFSAVVKGWLEVDEVDISYNPFKKQMSTCDEILSLLEMNLAAKLVPYQQQTKLQPPFIYSGPKTIVMASVSNLVSICGGWSCRSEEARFG